MDVPLAEVVAASRAVAATRSRTAKTQVLADLFARCDPAEVGLVVSHLSGVLPQRRLGVGYRSLGSLPEPAVEPALTVVEVDAAFTRLAATAAEVARLAAVGGVEALEQVGLVVGRPVRPMLAASAKTAREAVDA